MKHPLPVLLILLLAATVSLGRLSTLRADSPRPANPSVSLPSESLATTKSVQKDASPADQTNRHPAVAPENVMAPPMMKPIQDAPPHDPTGHDWIRLTSGEWLKGDILSLRDRTLVFDSDEMDEQEFDWEDVAEVRSPHLYTYVFTDRTILVGTALILPDEVVLSCYGDKVVRHRVELMSIVPAGDRELDRWDGKASIGFSFRRGNTDQTDFTYKGFIRRRDALTRARLDLNGAISETDGEEQVNNHRSVLKFDLFATPRFYFTPLAVNIYHDEFQNIDIQVTPYAGVGYHAVDKRKISVDVELAGGYQYTKYKSLEAGTDSEQGAGSLIPTIRLEWDPHKRVEIDGLYTSQIGLAGEKNTTMHGELILSLELTKILDLDIAWIWDRVQDPQPNEDGTMPRKDDVKLTIGIGVDF